MEAVPTMMLLTARRSELQEGQCRDYKILYAIQIGSIAVVACADSRSDCDCDNNNNNGANASRTRCLRARAAARCSGWSLPAAQRRF